MKSRASTWKPRKSRKPSATLTPATELGAKRHIADFIISAFESLIKTPAQYRLGFDVAASGEGDLACIYIDRKEAPRLQLAGLFTCRTDDWNFLQDRPVDLPSPAPGPPIRRR